jgi:hypothetical protein
LALERTSLDTQHPSSSPSSIGPLLLLHLKLPRQSRLSQLQHILRNTFFVFAFHIARRRYCWKTPLTADHYSTTASFSSSFASFPFISSHTTAESSKRSRHIIVLASSLRELYRTLPPRRRLLIAQSLARTNTQRGRLNTHGYTCSFS